MSFDAVVLWAVGTGLTVWGVVWAVRRLSHPRP